MPEQRTRKLLTLASEQDADDVSRAVFEQWRADTLARTGHAELDCYLDGTPLPVQITTRYVAPPSTVYDLDADGAPKLDPRTGEPIVLVPSDPRALVIDDVVETMQGKQVDIRGAGGESKRVTIDVRAAVSSDVIKPVDVRASEEAFESKLSAHSLQKPSLARRATIVAGAAVGFGSMTAGVFYGAGQDPTLIGAAGVAMAALAGVYAFVRSNPKKDKS